MMRDMMTAGLFALAGGHSPPSASLLGRIEKE